MVEDEMRIRLLLAGSKRLEADKDKSIIIGQANRLLMWEAIQYAHGKGLVEFDLGGYYTGDDENDPRININKFKKSFGGELQTLYNYRKYYSRLYRLLKFGS